MMAGIHVMKVETMINPTLLEDVKADLDITWDTEDETIKKIIGRSMKKLTSLTGTIMNFDEEGEPKTLLLNCCRYDYNKALEYFETNFRSEILRLQLQEAVKANASNE